MAGSGDVLGRKRLLFIALVVFVGASVLCALAPTMLALIAARVLQGAGGGGLMTLSQALVGEIVPPRERPRYQGYLAGTFMVLVHLRPGGGRLADAAFRLGVGVPGQPAAGRAGVAAGAPAAGAAAAGRRRSGSIGWAWPAGRLRGAAAAGARAGAADVGGGVPLVAGAGRAGGRARCGCCCSRSGGRRRR